MEVLVVEVNECVKSVSVKELDKFFSKLSSSSIEEGILCDLMVVFSVEENLVCWVS